MSRSLHMSSKCSNLHVQTNSIRMVFTTSKQHLLVIVLEGRAEKSTSIRETFSLVNEYAKNDSTADLVSVLRSAGFNVIQRFVTLSTVDSSLDSALAEAASMNKTPVIFNLCDGLESDGYPGISVPRACAARNVAFTGADMDFFANTTAKTDMKRRFLSHGVSTAVHIELNQLTQPAEIDALNSYPLLVKPSVSYASCSITDASVVYSASEALAQAARVRAEVVAGGVFAESFLNGREYTALVMSGPSLQSQPVCLPVAERVFDSSLPQHQRFLAFNRYWAGYDTTQSQPSEDVTPLYSYAIAPAETQTNLQQLAVRAFQACTGRSYGRVDIRTRSVDDTDGHTACVLEVNSQPGLSFEANTSSAAELLRLSRIEPTAFVIALIVNALSLHHQHDVELV